MLTIESLKEYGADVDAGLALCMNLKDFYLRMVSLELEDKTFPRWMKPWKRKM